jgi:glutathione S-transferase
VTRDPETQRQVDEQTRRLVLYQFRMCPFCIKVRRAIRRLSLDIRSRDVLRDPASREQLMAGGGEVKVPCLRIETDDGHVEWLYESSDIIQYLRQRFA